MCIRDSYGNDCNTQCGKCAGNEMCDVNSGDCTEGCRGNWQEPKCYGKEIFLFYFQVTNYISLVTCLTYVLHMF